MNPQLTELVAKKQGKGSPAGAIDWNERRQTYLAAVDSLYALVRQAFADAIADGSVIVETRSKKLTEDYIGTYQIDDLLLRIGPEQVLFSPVGRNIAGATGRVDVVGERAQSILIVQPGPRWSFVQSRQPTLRTTPLDDASLAEVLAIVMKD